MKTLNATTLMTVGRCYTTDAAGDSSEPKDNQYFAWIQDLVSGNRTISGLAEELRRGCIVGAGDPSPV